MPEHDRWKLSPHVEVKAPVEYAEGWATQRSAAAEILRRFNSQSGVILADQVGMGKTFTALAVAASIALDDPQQRPVVILVPKAVSEKWIADWVRFARTYLDHEAVDRICGPQAAITRPGAFFSALAEPPATRRHILVATHRALSNSAIMQFAEIAVLWAATGGADPSDEGRGYRRQFAKWCGHSEWAVTGRNGFTTGTVQALLETPPEQWKDLWEELTGRPLDWDPVPAAVVESLGRLDLEPVLELLDRSPRNRSDRLEERLAETGGEIKKVSRGLWREAMAGVHSELSLLILDEAHHTKNDGTQLSGLFKPRTPGTADGILHGAADRMLFLTATPFELGHDELLRILGRFSAAKARDVPETFTAEVREELRTALIAARHTSRQLERSWGRIIDDDLNYFHSWSPGAIPEGLPAAVRAAWQDAQKAVRARKAMNRLLRKWLIRHERPRNRALVEGAKVVPGAGEPAGAGAAAGIAIDDDLALPFLLAARIHSLAARGKPRPNFAYGIASSFQTYLRLGDGADTVSEGADDPPGDSSQVNGEPASSDSGAPASETSGSGEEPSVLDSEMRWYDERVRAAIGIGSTVVARHPKIEATTSRVMHHWLRREKVVVFCWYTRTVRAVHSSVESAIRAEVRDRGARAFGLDPSDGKQIDREYKNLAARLLAKDSESRTHLAYREINDRLVSYFRSVVSKDAHPELPRWVAEVVIRNLRTPEHLARVEGLGTDLDAEGLLADFDVTQPSGRSLADAWADFAQRVDSPSGHPELFRDLLGRDIQYAAGPARPADGLHGVPDGDDDPYRDDDVVHSGEGTDIGRGSHMEAVRFAYGQTAPETRSRLARVFTTPSAPEVLIAGSVMGEGIDLHSECDVAIHHDLDWNPGVVEQRTGRIERIGSLAERRGTGITVYVPYLAGTHDEKQFRVVRDRQQWFDLVMGSRKDGGLENGDEESRVPLAQPIVDAMTLDLAVE